MSAGLFAELDEVPLARVTEGFGSVFAAAAAIISPGLINDDAVSPEVFRAGLCKAHLIGFASAVVHADANAEQDELLISGVAEFLRETLAQFRSAA